MHVGEAYYANPIGLSASFAHSQAPNKNASARIGHNSKWTITSAYTLRRPSGAAFESAIEQDASETEAAACPLRVKNLAETSQSTVPELFLAIGLPACRTASIAGRRSRDCRGRSPLGHERSTLDDDGG
jgi:hypothetical protein